MSTQQQELQADLIQSLYALRMELLDMLIANNERDAGPRRNFRVIAPKPHSDEDIKAVKELIRETEDQMKAMR